MRRFSWRLCSSVANPGKVAELRRDLALTQAELAEKFGVPFRHLHHIESGELNVCFITIMRPRKRS